MIIKRLALLSTFVGLFFILSCQTQKEKKSKNASHDAVLNGLINSYDKHGTLSSSSTYQMGVLNGPAVFYTHGKIDTKLSYVDGRENGYQYNYDESGNIKLITYYYFGKMFGPSIQYSKNKPTQYIYNAFSGETLAYYVFDTSGHMKDHHNDVFYMNINYVSVSNIDKIDLFLYLITPPKMVSKYYVSTINTNREIKEFIQIPDSAIFCDTIIDPAPKGIHYLLTLKTYDSTTGKSVVAYKEVLSGGPNEKRYLN